MSSEIYAPIIIPTLNRCEHLKRCVESLAANPGASRTELFIGLDYPAGEAHREGYEKICSYVETITGFKNVNIIRHSENLGAQGNLRTLFDTVFSKYECCIATEDDNIFSPNFLEYINTGLRAYRDKEEIFAVCGYNYPVKMPASYKHPVYYSHEFSAWGYGIWKERYYEYRALQTPVFARSVLDNPARVKKIYRHNPELVETLILLLQNVVRGDGLITIHQLLEKHYSVFPTVSKVRNLGHDGTGLHCNDKGSAMYGNQTIDMSGNFDFTPPPIKEDKRINKILYGFFRKELTVRLYTRLSLYLYKKKNIALKATKLSHK